jgi:hypothetical protein
MKKLIVCLFLLSMAPSHATAQKQDAPTAASFDHRLWTSNAGTSIKAKLIGVAGNEATLAKEDGSVVKVKLDKLSISDQAYCNWIINLVQAKAPQQQVADLPSDVHFIVRLEQSFRKTQLEMAAADASDLTNAAKRIAWDKTIDLMETEFNSAFNAAPKNPDLVLATVLEAEESYEGYSVKTQVEGSQNFIDLIINGRPKELTYLKSGESIQFHASLKPSSKLKLTAKLTLPWVQKQSQHPDQSSRLTAHLGNMINYDGLSVPIYVSMFTKQEK